MGAEVNGYVVEVECPLSPEAPEYEWFPLKGTRTTLSAARAALEATRRMPEYAERKMRIVVPRQDGKSPDVLLEVNPGDPPCIELS